MGRAARRKRQRRTPRPWTTRNPWTGQPETFMVSISDEELRSWERERMDLRAQGYADRPPDVATPKIRGWVPTARVGDPQAIPRLDAPSRPVGTWSAFGHGVAFSADLVELEDGVYQVIVQAGPPGSPQTYLAQMEPDLAGVAQFIRAWAARYGLTDLRYASAELR
jgi:hypothetical protein